MTTITIEHITKRFEQVSGSPDAITAVDDVSLKLNDGEVLAILGPSGCGKSTLLRIIAGLLMPDSGQVLYDNLPLDEVSVQDRGIGMVFQEGALVPHWESGRSVGFFMHLRKRDHEVPERVKRISKITGIGLNKLMERRPRQLSGGEQQRISIARALTRDMQILLFDEPFSNLDAKMRTESRVELKRLLNEFPVTSVYVTHDQIEAIALTQKIGIMREGKFEQVGNYQTLYDSPVNLFVATFLGTPAMNVFEGYIHDAHWYGESFGGYPVRNDLPDGTKVTMGIRPQFMRLEAEGVPGVVDTITPFWAERYQLVEVWLASERWELALPLDEQITLGETIYCALDEDQVFYFDTKTGQRIG